MTDMGALYRGVVVHKRLRPREHALSYNVFSLLLDVDRLQQLSGSLKLFSYNRWNLLSFFDRDHGPSLDGSIAAHARGLFARAGIGIEGGRVLLLAYPRVLGYVFNPISVYYGFGRDGTLEGLIYEVNNTFGERKSYTLRAGPAHSGVYAQATRKELFVSPFAEGGGHYSFRVTAPGEALVLAVLFRDADGPLIKTHFKASAADLSDRTILLACLSLPLMTLKVMAAIHWEALKLWWKGIPLAERHTSPPYSESINLEEMKL